MWSWQDLRSLLGTERPPRGVAACHSVGDLRDRARRRVPRPVFDYVDGAAGDEMSLERSTAAFRSVEFHPRVLRNVTSVSAETTILGRRSPFPLVLGPTGFTRMMHHSGEPAVARVAAAAGIPYTLSTMGTTSIEDLVDAAPGADLWFQLYIWRDRARSKDLVDRATEAGYRVLVVTVDVPVAGPRLRDVRNGLTIPPRLTLRSLAGMARYPSWWANVVTSPPLSFATFAGAPSDLAGLINSMFDPSVTVEDLEWLRGQWDGPLVVKGITTLEAAREVVAAGADGIVVSNHGGRQLDRSPVTLEALPAIAAALGDRCEILLDGGIRSGADVIAGVALGARACMVGRAYLYGLMAGGEAGVKRAVDLLTAEALLTLRLLGATGLGDLGDGLVSLRPAPR